MACTTLARACGETQERHLSVQAQGDALGLQNQIWDLLVSHLAVMQHPVIHVSTHYPYTYPFFAPTFSHPPPELAREVSLSHCPYKTGAKMSTASVHFRYTPRRGSMKNEQQFLTKSCTYAGRKQLQARFSFGRSLYMSCVALGDGYGGLRIATFWDPASQLPCPGPNLTHSSCPPSVPRPLAHDS